MKCVFLKANWQLEWRYAEVLQAHLKRASAWQEIGGKWHRAGLHPEKVPIHLPNIELQKSEQFFCN